MFGRNLARRCNHVHQIHLMGTKSISEMPTCTYFVKRQGLPKPLDGIICTDKRKCSSTNDPDAHHGIPEIQPDSEVLPSNEDELYRPHTKELYGYIATEDLLESRCQLIIFGSRGFVELVRKRDLLIVVLGEQAHLFANLVSKRSCEPVWRSSPCAAFPRARELCTPHGRILRVSVRLPRYHFLDTNGSTYRRCRHYRPHGSSA